MSSRLCNEYPRKACASHDPGHRLADRSGRDPRAHPTASCGRTSLIRHDCSLYNLLSLATELLTADVPVAAMAPRTWARPEKSAAGFHLSLAKSGTSLVR